MAANTRVQECFKSSANEMETDASWYKRMTKLPCMFHEKTLILWGKNMLQYGLISGLISSYHKSRRKCSYSKGDNMVENNRNRTNIGSFSCNNQPIKSRATLSVRIEHSVFIQSSNVLLCMTGPYRIFLWIFKKKIPWKLETTIVECLVQLWEVVGIYYS